MKRTIGVFCENVMRTYIYMHVYAQSDDVRAKHNSETTEKLE